MTRGKTVRGQHRPRAGQGVRGRAYPARSGRQRSIRLTITILLVVPLLSLIALWGYAAASTVGGALTKRNADALDGDIGGPLQSLTEQLETERADTFTWQSGNGRVPAAPLAAQRKKTDGAVTALRAGLAAGAGLEPATGRQATATLLTELSRLGPLRKAVDAGRIASLTAFGEYNAIADALPPFVISITYPDESIALLEQSQAEMEEGEAVDDIGREAALVGGALLAGDTMTAGEHQAFVQAVADQRLFEQLANNSQDWQQSPDPYLSLFKSNAFRTFQSLEDKIGAAPAGSRLPVSPSAWETSVGTVSAGFIAPGTTARLSLTRGDAHEGDMILLRLFLVGGIGLVAVVVSSLMLLRFGNRITRELTRLRGAARSLAQERLPSVVSRLGAGLDVDVDAEAPPLVLHTRTREVTETADAFSAVQRTAVAAAVRQAELRRGVSDVFRSLARRNQSLVQRQLKMLDDMERGTEDPQALAQLFKLDHLTTRMRRQAEGLIILSGAPPGRGWRQPVPIVEVLRGAIGEIEDYERVEVATDSPDFIQGGAVADVTHLLAELVENATRYSPPSAAVRVTGSRVASGYAIEVEDRGLGIPEDRLAELNERLHTLPEFDVADSGQLGLFVVSRLAARHGIKVTLEASAYDGIRAVVLLPAAIVTTGQQAGALAPRPVPLAVAARAGSWPTALSAPPRYATAPYADRPADAGTFSGSRSDPVGAYPDGYGGLPRRIPQSSLAAQLRDRGKAHAGSEPAAAAERSPEQAGARLSAIQQGWRRGRSAGGPGATGRDDSSPIVGGPGYEGSGR